MKKIMSMIIVLAMSVSMGVTAFADIQPRTPTCPDCGKPTIKYTIVDPGLAPSDCDICGQKKVNGTCYYYKYVCTDPECEYEEYTGPEFICDDCR